MGKTTLDKIPLNCEVYIDSIECGNGIKNRINDMGITEGEKIIPIIKSPFGDPRAYLSKRHCNCSQRKRLRQNYGASYTKLHIKSKVGRFLLADKKQP